jgi:chloramphenicol-sensitive protein RarD
MPSAPPGLAELRGATRRGMVWATAAFLWWGLSPVYWKALAGVAAEQLLAHRVLWSLALLVVLLTLRRSWRAVGAAVTRPRTLGTLLLTTGLIAVNWYTYIWAMAADRVLEASLGYYVNPLVNVLLGVVFLRERLRRAQTVAVALAAVGVAALTAEVGRVPWVSLLLALTFGFYGLLRKTVAAGPLVGLAVETALLAPVALVWLARLHAAGGGALGAGPGRVDLLIVASGVITVAPLVWFTRGARLLPLSTLGLLQYLAPTLQFLLAVAVYREPFSALHLAAFALIWAGLALFTWDLRRRLGRPVPRAGGIVGRRTLR